MQNNGAGDGLQFHEWFEHLGKHAKDFLQNEDIKSWDDLLSPTESDLSTRLDNSNVRIPDIIIILKTRQRLESGVVSLSLIIPETLIDVLLNSCATTRISELTQILESFIHASLQGKIEIIMM